MWAAAAGQHATRAPTTRRLKSPCLRIIEVSEVRTPGFPMRKLWPRLLPNGDPAGILPDFCTRSLYAPARTGSTLAWTVHCASSLRCRGLVPPLEPR